MSNLDWRVVAAFTGERRAQLEELYAEYEDVRKAIDVLTSTRWPGYDSMNMNQKAAYIKAVISRSVLAPIEEVRKGRAYRDGLLRFVTESVVVDGNVVNLTHTVGSKSYTGIDCEFLMTSDDNLPADIHEALLNNYLISVKSGNTITPTISKLFVRSDGRNGTFSVDEMFRDDAVSIGAIGVVATLKEDDLVVHIKVGGLGW